MGWQFDSLPARGRRLRRTSLDPPLEVGRALGGALNLCLFPPFPARTSSLEALPTWADWPCKLLKIGSGRACFRDIDHKMSLSSLIWSTIEELELSSL